MIPTIETIVDGLIAGKFSKQQATKWLNIHSGLNTHSECDANDLRDAFAMAALAHPYTEAQSTDKVAAWAYQIADSMMLARAGGR